ncbi:MAG: nickel-dependent lactate racemase [Desulfitobacterium hafniense]|nr:nickel-dependent lactate racemase [Desulfitobacterium hafniense]
MIKIPFDKQEIEINIDQKNLIGILEPKIKEAIPNPHDKIRQMLKHPINRKPLSEDVRGKTKVCIVVTDITRPCPDDMLLPLIVQELEDSGIKKENIIILVGTGLHRPNTDEELMTKLGKDIFSKIKVVNHTASDMSNLLYLGNTSLGCPIWVNRLVVEADFVISTGIIEPHFFAGFSGGRKGLAIGAAGEETIKFQHSPRVFDHPKTLIGNLEGNIFHQNAMEIAKTAGLDFIVNVVLNHNGEICGVVAGDIVSAFLQGVEIAREIYQVEIEEQADIAIAGVGYPKSTNLYQGTRGASCIAFSQYPVVKKGGIVITPIPAEEGPGKGLGEQRFYEIMKKAESLDSLINNIRVEGYPAGGQRAYLLALTLKHAELVITNTKAPDAVENMFMKYMASLEEALKYGLERFGNDAKVVVLPHSVQVMTVKSEDNQQNKTL